MIMKFLEASEYLAKKMPVFRIEVSTVAHPDNKINASSKKIPLGDILGWLNENVSAFNYESGHSIYGETWMVHAISNTVIVNGYKMSIGPIEKYAIEFNNSDDLVSFKLRFS